MLAPWSYLLCHYILCTVAISWPGRTKSQVLAVSGVSPVAPPSISDQAFADIEIEREMGHRSLDHRVRRSDCFRRAAGLVGATCSRLDMLEDERVKAAIMMTLCELATAKHHSPPLECAAFALSSSNPQDGFAEVDRDNMQGVCVDALSRSAQFWSSYSGYLREVPQLCTTFKTWNEIDVAREIYRNVTLEKLKLLGDLRDREEAFSEELSLWSERIYELRQLHSQMESLLHTTDTASGHLVQRVERSFNTALDVFVAATEAAQSRVNEEYIATIQRLGRTADELSLRQTRLLEGLVPAFERALVERLDQLYSLSYSRYVVLDDLANETTRRFLDLSNEITIVQSTVGQISIAAHNTADIISTSNDQMRIVQGQHLQAARSAGMLSSSIISLTNMASASMNAINDTAMKINSDLHHHPSSIGLLWAPVFRWIATSLLRDPNAQEYLLNYPVIHYALSVMKIVSCVIRSSIMFIASVLVALVSLLLRRKDSHLSHPLLHNNTQPTLNSSASTDVSTRFSALSQPSLVPSIPDLPRSGFPQSLHRSSGSWRPRRLSRIPDRLCQPNSYAF